MSYIPSKMPSGADTFSNLASYKATVNLAPATVPSYTTLFTTDNNMGSFVVTDIILHLDNVVGTNYLTYTSSIGWNSASSAYDNIAGSQVKGSTSTSSTSNSLWLRTNKFEWYRLQTETSGYAQNYATTANTATDVVLKITNSILGSGSTGTILVTGYYTGMRP